MIEAVIFDLDGVLIDSEHVWDRARRDVAREHGGTWVSDATASMQGMSSVEWARYMQQQLGVRLDQQQIIERVLEALFAAYANGLPLLPGALEAVRRLAQRWPLGLASSSNRSVIDHVLRLADLADLFAATVSSEEVARGKPSPDVYLEAARRLDKRPEACVAVEDSANGIRSAVAGRTRVVAVPNQAFPPPEDVVATASLVLSSLDELTVNRLATL
jgi:HAD superfamily hydrolase (TIGR01509 family)